MKSVEFLYRTVDEILNLVNIIDENRCSYDNIEEAHSHGYSISDTQKTKRRLKYYETRVFGEKKQWLISSPMIVYEVDGKEYMVDGQGRFRALIEYNKKAKVNERINTIPVLLFRNKTKEEMISDMIELNRHGKNWSTSDIFRCYSIKEGKSDLYNKLMDIEDKLGVKEYTAKLILFGYGKSSHRDKIIDASISQYSDVVYSAFDKFYKGTSIACGGDVRQINAIKKQDTAQALYAVLAKVIRVCEDENLPYQKRLDVCVNSIVKGVNKLNRDYEFPQVFGGKQKSIASSFKRFIKKAVKDKYIKYAMTEA